MLCTRGGGVGSLIGQLLCVDTCLAVCVVVGCVWVCVGEGQKRHQRSGQHSCYCRGCGQMVLSFQGTTHLVEAYVPLDSQELRRMEAARSATDNYGNGKLHKAMEQFAKLHVHKATSGAPNKKSNPLPTSEGEKLYYKGVAIVYTGPVRVRLCCSCVSAAWLCHFRPLFLPLTAFSLCFDRSLLNVACSQHQRHWPRQSHTLLSGDGATQPCTDHSCACPPCWLAPFA